MTVLTVLLFPKVSAYFVPTVELIADTSNINPIYAGIFAAYGFFFFVVFMTCLANLIMLELVQEIETEGKISSFKVIKEIFTIDIIKAIPLCAILALVWWLIFLIILGRKKRGRTEHRRDTKDLINTTITSDMGIFSKAYHIYIMIKEAATAVIFMALPAIAWENKGPYSAFSRSVEIIKKHPVQFLTTASIGPITLAAMFLVMLPLAAIGSVSFTAMSITFVIAEALIWMTGMYLEQMSIALLYLWHLKWAKQGGVGTLSSVKRPDILDEFHEFKEEANANEANANNSDKKHQPKRKIN
jgi:hypothetical protein